MIPAAVALYRTAVGEELTVDGDKYIAADVVGKTVPDRATVHTENALGIDTTAVDGIGNTAFRQVRGQRAAVEIQRAGFINFYGATAGFGGRTGGGDSAFSQNGQLAGDVKCPGCTSKRLAV